VFFPSKHLLPASRTGAYLSEEQSVGWLLFLRVKRPTQTHTHIHAFVCLYREFVSEREKERERKKKIDVNR
jgi:hypothetical protein